MTNAEMQAENRRGAVIDLQRYLRHLSYANEAIPRVPVDGIFDSKTEEAVLAYQRLSGLPVTGKVDYETWVDLQNAYNASLAQTSEPEQLAVFPLYPIGYCLDNESDRYRIYLLQYILGELRLLFDTIPPVPKTGVYDEETRVGVRRFREAEGLPAGDTVDLATWNALARCYNRLSAETQA